MLRIEIQNYPSQPDYQHQQLKGIKTKSINSKINKLLQTFLKFKKVKMNYQYRVTYKVNASTTSWTCSAGGEHEAIYKFEQAITKGRPGYIIVSVERY